MPQNKEMVGKALKKGKKYEDEELILEGYDPDKEYKLHIKKVERLAGGKMLDKIKGPRRKD